MDCSAHWVGDRENNKKSDRCGESEARGDPVSNGGIGHVGVVGRVGGENGGGKTDEKRES